MRLLTFIFFFTFIFSLCSCVSDTDFDQADEIVFTPEIVLDFIFFNLDAGDFFDASTSTPRLTLRDTTALEFLDADDITGSIEKIEFLFDFNNSIPSTFEVDFQFLNNDNEPTYETATIVAAGSPGSTVQTLFSEEVEGQDLNDLERASKVVVSITIPAADKNLTGSFALQSIATYYIEF